MRNKESVAGTVQRDCNRAPRGPSWLSHPVSLHNRTAIRGGVLAEHPAFQAHYRSCPRHQRVACPQDLQAARGLKGGELRVSWQRVANPQDSPTLLEPVVTVIVDGGADAIVGTAPAGATSVLFDSVPRGRDLAIAAALTRQGHVISEVCRIRIRSTQTRTGDRTPSRVSSPAPVSATVTTTTTDAPPVIVASTDTPPVTSTDTLSALPLVTGLATAAGTPAHSSINLSWTAPTPPANHNSFLLQQCGDAGCTGTPTDIAAAKAATSHTVTSGLARNTSYHFRIRAVAAPNSGFEDSAWSSTVQGRTAKEKLPQVASLTAAAGTPAHSSINLSWTAPNPANHDNFRLERCGNASCTGTPAEAVTPAAGDTTSTVTGLTRNTAYHFRIQAAATSSSDYADSDWSSPVTHTTAKEPLPAVSGLVASGLNPSTLTWNSYSHAQLDSFEIRVCSTNDCATITETLTAAATATSRTHTCAATPCHYQIRAKAKDGSDYTYGPWSG